MVLCFVALPVFAFLSIFSVRYRKLTLDALDCLLRTVTLRKCSTELDKKIKADLTGRVMKLSPKTARFFYKNYKVISWILLAILVWSLVVSAGSLYNLAKYGDCNGPDDSGFCPVTDLQNQCGTSEANVDFQAEPVPAEVDDTDPVIGSEDANLTIIEFGCYTCEYTRRGSSVINKVLEHYDGKVNLQFKSFPIPKHNLSYKTALAADCAFNQNLYEEFYRRYFSLEGKITMERVYGVAESTGLNTTEFRKCIEEERFKDEIDSDKLEGVHAGVRGTPTFFINGRKVVESKPFKTFKAIIDKELSNKR